jgi:acetyltransferase-like isoleucine patch superfamily enzyme
MLKDAIIGAYYKKRLIFSDSTISIGSSFRPAGKFIIKGPGTVTIGNNVFFHGIRGDVYQHTTILTLAADARVTIGDNCRLCACRISSKFEVCIGRGVLIEESGILDTQFHSLHPDRGDAEDETLEQCRIVIGAHVKIGARSMIAKGVTIGDNTILYPGSIVTQSLPANTIAMGNPARPLKQ